SRSACSRAQAPTPQSTLASRRIPRAASSQRSGQRTGRVSGEYRGSVKGGGMQEPGEIPAILRHAVRNSATFYPTTLPQPARSGLKNRFQINALPGNSGHAEKLARGLLKKLQRALTTPLSQKRRVDDSGLPGPCMETDTMHDIPA